MPLQQPVHHRGRNRGLAAARRQCRQCLRRGIDRHVIAAQRGAVPASREKWHEPIQRVDDIGHDASSDLRCDAEIAAQQILH